MAEPVLLLEDVSLRSFDGEPVFDSIDWTLERGCCARFTPVPSSGTTALLRLCAGLAQPEKGRVFLYGVPYSPASFSHRALRRGKVGWVPTRSQLVVNLDLLSNIALPLRYTKDASKTKAEVDAMQWLEKAGLDGMARLRPHFIDPRDQWLAALVRCAATRAEIWLVDSPPCDLDPETAELASKLLDQAETAIVVDSMADGWAGTRGFSCLIDSGRIRTGGA